MLTEQSLRFSLPMPATLSGAPVGGVGADLLLGFFTGNLLLQGGLQRKPPRALEVGRR
jgi:hypothetical protein